MLNKLKTHKFTLIGILLAAITTVVAGLEEERKINEAVDKALEDRNKKEES